MTTSENGQRFSLPLPLDHFFFCFLAPDAAGAILNDEFWWFGDEQERERQSWLQGLFLCAVEKAGRFFWSRAARKASVARAGAGPGLCARTQSSTSELRVRARPSLGQPSPNQIAPPNAAIGLWRCTGHGPHNWGRTGPFLGLRSGRLGLDHLRRGHQKIPTTTRHSPLAERPPFRRYPARTHGQLQHQLPRGSPFAVRPPNSNSKCLREKLTSRPFPSMRSSPRRSSLRLAVLSCSVCFLRRFTHRRRRHANLLTLDRWSYEDVEIRDISLT